MPVPSAALPQPQAAFRAPGVRFEVYRAKACGTSRWESAALRDIVLQARESYDVYGKRPRCDAFDDKSAIYLVRDEYVHATTAGPTAMTSWFSNRFVPNAGEPRGAAELDICRVGARTAEELLRKQRFGDSSTFLEHIVSYSRMCKIGPNPVAAGRDARLAGSAQRHPHSAACFALTCEQFARDYLDGREHGFRYITGLIRNDLIENALTVRNGGRTVRPAFTSATRMLGVPRTSMRLDRKAYTYDFPGYFLSHAHLYRLMLRLIRTRAITDETLLGTLGVPTRHFLQGDARTALRPILARLSAITTATGRLPGTTLTGEEVRALIDRFVPDGPELKINPLPSWRRSIQRLVSALHIQEDLPTATTS